MLALALSMIMGAIPVYAVEDVPEVTDIGEEPQADNGGQPEVWSEPGTGGTASEPEADETAAGAKAGEASPALEAAGTASEPGTDEIGVEPQEQADTGSIEIPDDTEVTGTILQDAIVNVFPGNENKIWVNDQYLSDALLMGNNFYTFFRLDLKNYGGMKFEYAKIRLYNKKGVGNTVVYDKAIVPSGKDLWTADTLVTANMPSWEDETNPKYKATIPGTKDFAEIDVTALVNEAVEAGEETLEIKVGEKNASTSPAEVSSSKYADESKRPSLVLKREHVLSDEEKAAKVIGEIEKLNGMYLSEKVPFPFDAFKDEGVTVTWTSSNPAVVSTDGMIHQAEDGNVGVEITAVVSSGSVSQSTAVSVTVLRKQQVSPYARESLEKLIQYTEDSLKNAKEGNQPGDYSTEKRSALDKILKDAKAALAARDQDNAYAAHCSNIISAGTEYFGSGKTSDKVVKTSADNNGNGNLLEYSSYRAKLVSLVWAAEAQMLVEPQMYSEAAKEALKEEIRLAKKALDGTYGISIQQEPRVHYPKG